MKKLRLIAAGLIAGAFMLLSPGAAQAYPPNDVEVIIHIQNATLIGGKTVHFTATTNTPGLNCNWTIKLSNGTAPGVGETLTGSGTSFSGSYKTKVVSAIQKHPLTAICAYDDADLASSGPISHSNSVTPAVFVSGSGSTLLAAPQTASATATVTLLPLGGDNGDNGSLPNTGGSNLWILVLGGALLVGGGAVIIVARSRSTH